ncbi:hypothetical protein DUNSADRAFT_17061 [Dunaliella salina]|uniref:Uncharacterized protein n=1 Tax=Dunaliella salina TaxID=3046 RepID=A0ABQ7H0I2_DUNSA|nr:hypothetical protein DUNSADRAFT_17061 [Dunaliella salina]|eukprot:KAF5840363.1 hypothetical protein DUNSADRAFT_17061 [Dunaliella salina]
MVVWPDGAMWLPLLLHAYGLVLVSSQKTCDFVPPNDFSGGKAIPKVKCLSQKRWTADAASSMAMRYAPILYFHPMEQYGLTDPAHYFREAVVYDSSHKPNLEAVSASLSYLSILGNPEQDAIIRGAPLDDNGLSTARVFFNVYPLPGKSNAWVYNFHLYYAWNGCSNMAMSTAAQGGGQSTLEFVACPYSVHEADWERISVVVCPEDQPDLTSEQEAGSKSNIHHFWQGGKQGQETERTSDMAREQHVSSVAGKGRVMAAVLSQHNHDELIQCTGATGCEFENGHLLVYVGLNSHANFAHASNGTIYGGVRNDQKHYASSSSSSSSSGGGEGNGGKLGNMEGVVLLDRTAKGAKWMPSLTNLAPLPRKQQRRDGGQSSVKHAKNKAAWSQQGRRPLGKAKGGEGKDGVAKAALAGDEDAWAFYPGFWGTRAWKMSPSVTCFKPGLLQPGPCPPDSPSWRLLAQTLGVPVHQEVPPPQARPILALPVGGTAPPVTESYHAKGGAKQGPNYRSWTGHWQPPQPTKMWHLPARNLAYRLFVNGNERQPLLRCLPGMGGTGMRMMGDLGLGGEQRGQGAAAHGLTAEGASVPLEFSRAAPFRGPGLLPHTAVMWASAIEPFLCLVVLMLWMTQALFMHFGNEETGEVAPNRAWGCSALRDPWPSRFMHCTGSAGVMCSVGSGMGLAAKGQSGGGQMGQNSMAPLLGLVSLACGMCAVYGARPYFLLMTASMPAASPLVDAMRLLFGLLIGVLVVMDVSCALSGLPSLISKLRSSKAGGHFRDPAGGCASVFQTCCAWWKAVKAPVQQCTTHVLLGLVVLCVVAQATVQAANGLLSFALPLHSPSSSWGRVEFAAGQTSAPVLVILLFLRSLFGRWQLEAHATLLVIPCFFFVVRHGYWRVI